ncbi:MAG: hypothetical protein K9W42_05195 [Candidatus Heimdallarchaeota archaeon]|nr:hypothetical protein [Candidatus Heimdallarchaeota archaeon]
MTRETLTKILPKRHGIKRRSSPVITIIQFNASCVSDTTTGQFVVAPLFISKRGSI